MSALRRVLGFVTLLIAAGALHATYPGHFLWNPRRAVAPAVLPSPVLGGGAVIASDGESYLMVTIDGRGLRAMRMDSEGQIVDPRGIALRGEYVVSIAGNGSEWLIATTDATRLLRRDGTLQFPLVYLPRPQVISNGRNFFAWEGSFPQHARASIVRADGSGIIVDEHSLPESIATAASNGDVYCVATKTANAIFINIIDDTGRPLFAEPRKLMDVPLRDGRRVLRIELARVHGNFRVFWTESDETLGVRDADIAWSLSSADFNAAGTIVSEPQVIAAGIERGSSYDFYLDSLEVVQAGPADAVVRWSMGQYLPRMQTTLGCGTVFSATDGQLASNGRSMLMVRQEHLSPSSTGVVLRRGTFACDPASLLAAERELPIWAAPEQSDVFVAAGRADAIVAYSEQGRRHAHRVSHDGRVLGSIALPDDVHDARWFRIATDGRIYFAFWVPRDASAVRYAKLVASDWTAPVVKTIAPLSHRPDGFDAQWNGSEFLVAWIGKGLPFGGGQEIFGARITRGGTMLDPGVIEIVSPDSKFSRRNLALSRGDGDMLLAWTEQGAGTGLPCGGCTALAGARALRIGADATPLGAIEKLSSWYSQMDAVVRNDGAWYVFIRDSRSNTNRASRIHDDDATILEIDLGFAGFDALDSSSQQVTAFPMGTLGVGVYDGRSFDLLVDYTDRLEIYSDAAPALAGAGPPHEVMIAPAGDGLLAVFTSSVEEWPYAGAHRAFVSSVDLAPTAPKRRAVR